MAGGIEQSAEAPVFVKDGSDPDYRLHLLLVANGCNVGPYRARRLLRKTVLALTATAIGTAALALEDPVAPFAAISASVVSVLASMPNQANAAVSSADAAPVSRPADNVATTPRIATAAAAEAVDPRQSETDGTSSDGLLKQFLTWSHDQEAQEQLEAQQRQTEQLQAEQLQAQQAEASQPEVQAPPAVPAKPIVVAQDVPKRVVSSSPARAAQKQRYAARELRNARAEVQSSRHGRAKFVPAYQPAPQTRAVEPAHAPDMTAENGQPSLLQVLGWRN
jgi:hypothetical protein